MKNRIQESFVPPVLLMLVLFTSNFQPATVYAQGTAFIYQGQLQNDGAPASGSYNLTFALYNDATGGAVVAGPVTKSAVAVTNGLFTVTLDFGSGPWNGQNNWLQIAVETNSAAATFTSLMPRQPIAPVPYAIYAESGGTATALASGTALGSGSGNSIASGVSDAFIGGGNYNTAISNYVVIGGGYYNTASGDRAAMVGGFENAASGIGSFIGGGYYNTASGVYATVGGGYYNRAAGIGSFVGGGGYNQGTLSAGNNNYGDAAAIVGGVGNVIETNAAYAFIGGGLGNTVGNSGAIVGGGVFNTASGYGATVGGGGIDEYGSESGNQASGGASTVAGGLGNGASGDYATVSGGSGNTANGWYGAVVGGEWNTASGEWAIVGGGRGNVATGLRAATVAGGEFNIASDQYATVGGGYGNTASNAWATVSGGTGNAASTLGAVGGGAANTAGSQATVGGGNSNGAIGEFATVPGGVANLASGQSSFAAGNSAQATNDDTFVWSDGSAVTTSTVSNQFVARASGGFVFYTSITNTGVTLAPGSGSWSTMSDRNAKEDFAPVNSEALLAKVASLPMTTWSYKTEPGVRHIGPMAQDFYGGFKVGEDEKHIADVDEGGVALAAIQGLNQKVDSEAAALRIQNARLRQEVENLQQIVTQLSQKLNGDAQTTRENR